MTTVGEAFDNLGYALKDDETVAIVTVLGNRVITRRLQDVADEPIGANRYFSTGTFPKDTTFRRKGDRALDNVRRILELPFDFDLKDFLHCDKAELYDLGDDELQSYIEPLRQAVEALFGRLNLPIHRLDSTGYGLSAHVNVPSHKPESVKPLKELHAGIVRKLNSLFGETIADPQVSDAGSRIMRLVPCENVGAYTDGRSAPPRQTFTIARADGYVTDPMLRTAADAIAWSGKPVTVPAEGDALSDDECQRIIDAYRPYHNHGQKHFMGLGIAGQLGNARVPESQALTIVSAIASDDRKPWDRQKAVHDTYDKIRAGVTVSGFYILQSIVPEDVINGVDRILQKVKQANDPKITFIQDRQSGKLNDDPVKLFNPPLPPTQAFHGWHGHYLDLVYPTTAASIAFHLAASTTLQAALIGRRISTIYAGGRVYPCQYSLAVGPTGNSFKDTAYRRSIELIEHAQQGETDRTLLNTAFTITTDVASREAVIRSLSRHNNMYLFATEMVSILKNASRESTSTLLDALINIWDSPSVIQNNSIAAANDGTNIAHEPTLNIYGGIQPGRMAEQMTETMMTSGLGNRMAIFMGVGRGKLPRTPRMDPAGAAELYRELKQNIQSYPEGTELEMTPEAGERWDDWFLAVPDEQEEIAADMKVRYPVMIQKWALLFAVSDRAPAVGLEHIESAIALGDWMWECVRRLLPTWGTTPERKIEERMLTVLQQRQPIEKRILTQYVRGKWTSREVAQVLKSLSDTGQITLSTDRRFVCTAAFADVHDGKLG